MVSKVRKLVCRKKVQNSHEKEKKSSVKVGTRMGVIASSVSQKKQETFKRKGLDDETGFGEIMQENDR